MSFFHNLRKTYLILYKQNIALMKMGHHFRASIRGYGLVRSVIQNKLLLPTSST